MRYVLKNGVPTKYVRPTSIKSYEEIVETGWLGKAQEFVFNYLYHHGPATGAEGDHSTHSVGGHFHKRLSELRDMGVVEEVGTCKCPVTGKDAVLWDITGRAPTGPYKRVNKRDQEMEELRQLVAKLQEENNQLRQELQRRNHPCKEQSSELRGSLGQASPQ